MKIRHDALAVSSILFTVALLWLTPALMNWARATNQTRYGEITSYPEPGIPEDQVVIPNYAAPIGITSLAIIAIGLVVTWAGYIKAVRWTWFVMFVVVWLWAFPIVLLPWLRLRTGLLGFAQFFPVAIREILHGGYSSGMARAFLGEVLAFLLMVLALVLPVKMFILGRQGGPARSGRTNSGAPDKQA